MSTVRLQLDCLIYSWGLLKKSTLDEFRFGLIFFVEWGFWRRFISAQPFSRREAVMQGVQAFEPKAKASIDLESFVAEDHFLRRIDRILELSFVRELTAPRYVAEKGRPSIDP